MILKLRSDHIISLLSHHLQDKDQGRGSSDQQTQPSCPAAMDGSQPAHTWDGGRGLGPHPTTGLWTWNPVPGWPREGLMWPPASPLLWKVAASQSPQIPESALGGETPRKASTPQQALCSWEMNTDTFTGIWPCLFSGTQQTLVRAPVSPSLPLTRPPTSFCSSWATCSHHPSTRLHTQSPCPDPLLGTAHPSQQIPPDPSPSTYTTPSFVTPPITPCILSPGPRRQPLSPRDIYRVSSTSLHLCLSPSVSQPRSNELPENGKAAPSSPVFSQPSVQTSGWAAPHYSVSFLEDGFSDSWGLVCLPTFRIILDRLPSLPGSQLFLSWKQGRWKCGSSEM